MANSLESDIGLIGNAPTCPYCQEAVLDPDLGTVNCGVYDVLCTCGAWLELWRVCEVKLTVVRHSDTVPPYVFLGQ